MPATSKTGLLPAISHIEKHEKPHITTFELPKFITPAPYVLRPFAGVYNPFPYGCSVLCNHPADYEAKDVVRKAKESWVHDGKALLAPCDNFQRQSRAGSRGDEHAVAVPEELFRKYTDTDSRPITPAPTIASIITRSSHARRCVTPDPIPQPGREKTLLVLDLRRSQSQETLNWLGSQAGLTSPVLQAPTPAPSRSASSVGAPGTAQTAQSRKKKPLKGRNSASLLRAESAGETEGDAEASLKLKQQVLTNVKTLTVDGGGEGQRSDRSGVSSTGGDVVKRRGKKKKGKKAGGENGREGEKEFRGLPDPGETQVSTLGESRHGSTRPSLIPGGLLTDLAEQPVPQHPTAPKSFLTNDLLKQLQRQLDQQDVESEFDSNRKKALEEAFRTRPPAKQRHQCEELKTLKKVLRINESGTQKWLNIPRVFSRQSTRFELPMDTSLLATMSCLEYASRCAYPSNERLVIYNQIYNLYREELDEDEQVERSLLGKNLVKCLEAVMGRTLHSDETTHLMTMFGIADASSLNFRSFAGVAALCERLLGQPPPRPVDLPTTLEQTDFRCLDKVFKRVTVNPPLADLLTRIRDI